jgi:hypothetical protein
VIGVIVPVIMLIAKKAALADDQRNKLNIIISSKIIFILSENQKP